MTAPDLPPAAARALAAYVPQLASPEHATLIRKAAVWAVPRTKNEARVQSVPLSVTERTGAPVVSELVVSNGGTRPALLLKGELLEGGQQHRICSRSVLVPAREAVVLDVSCVEQGRWRGSTGHARQGRRAPASVRAANGQGEVWDEVARYEQRYGASPTHSLLDVTARLRPVPTDDLRPLAFQSGLLVGVGGQPLLLEVFDSPRTLLHACAPLLRSVALDAIRAPAVPTPGRRARRFVDRLGDLRLSTRAAGAATGFTGTSPYARLDSLVWQGRAIATAAINMRHELAAV